MRRVIFLLMITMVLVSCTHQELKPESVSNADSVQLIRNATLKIKYAGKTILVDPLFSEKGELQSILGVNKNPTVHLTMPIADIVNGVDFCLGNTFLF